MVHTDPRRERMLNYTKQLTSIRDNMTLFLCVSLIHISVNFLSTSSDCIHYVYGPWFAGILLIVSSFSIYYENTGWWTFVYDVFGVIFGSFFQVVTKPNNWWASLDNRNCDIETSPVALQFFFAGEIFSFSVFFRSILLTNAYWTGYARWSIVACLIICFASFSLALNAVTLRLK